MRYQRRRAFVLRIIATIAFAVISFIIFYRLLFGVAPEFDLDLSKHSVGSGVTVPEFLRRGRQQCVSKWFTDCGGSHRIDWHNATQVRLEKDRHGPGELGQAIAMNPEDDKEKEKLYQVNGFNALGSDRIAFNRSVPDIRHAKCRERFYDADLPTVSVIIPFHNEHWSTLLRTAVSVVDKSPDHILKEVLLVDDFSSKDFLKQKLDDYVRENLPKVRVLRAKRREGLIRTRLLGARAATGDVIIFLDSHCECSVNWLPPLLEPIARNYRVVMCPYIDVIDYETFQYRAQDEGARGAFDWEMYYKRLPVLKSDEKNMPEPFKSPVMAGGLFAMSRNYFWELGGYDEGLDIWGGEQYELSFKIWQCGGEMYDAPCSRVGHIYRKFAPFPNPGVGDFVGRNLKRVAEVWMDEYARYLYQRRKHYLKLDAGNLTEQRALREKLKCKPFKWFMEEIAFDLPGKYPPVEPPDFAWGELRLENTKQCVDAKFGRQNERFGLRTCNKDDAATGGEQKFQLTWHRDVRPWKRTMCFDVSSSESHAPIVLYGCHGGGGNQMWKYLPETRQMLHKVSKKCLDCDAQRAELFMMPCDADVATQRWVFEHVNATALASYNDAMD